MKDKKKGENSRTGNRIKGYQTTDDAERLFFLGATYIVLRDKSCLRDSFTKDERLIYWRHAHSFYDGMHGWFFFDPAGQVRSWDAPDVDAAARDELFEMHEAPPLLLHACARGDEATVRRETGATIPGFGLRRIAFESICTASSTGCLSALLQVPQIDDNERRRFLWHAAGADFSEGVRLLLDSGVPVDAADIVGQTALLHAAVSGALATVDLLLSRGADRTIRNSSGCTPEDLAVAFGRDAVVERLRKK